MTSVRLVLTPMETFFFRDARPFDKGEGWATGIFPPLPSTVYGAIRAAMIAQSTHSLSDFLDGQATTIHEEAGYKNALGTLHIRSIALHDGYGPLIPMPMDLRKRDNALVTLGPDERLDVISDTDLALRILERPDDSEEWITEWLGTDSLRKYLRGGKIEDAADVRERYLYEPKIGIEKNEQRIAADGMLYTQEMIRLHDGLQLSVETDSAENLRERGAIKLGHDGRLFAYRKMGNEQNYAFDEFRAHFTEALSTNGGRFKMLFTTPAILAGGWLPDNCKIGDCDGKAIPIWDHGAFVAQIESTVIGRPMRVGGWDLASGAPKTMRKAVPAGSVYFCRLLEGDPNAVLELFDNNLSDGDPDAEKQGFGHLLLALPAENEH